MTISLDKILQMDPSKEQTGILKNPFETWLTLKPNGFNYGGHVTTELQELISHPGVNQMSENATSSVSQVGDFERQANKFIYLAISSPMIFFAFLGLCILFLILFERRSRKKWQHGQDSQMEGSDSVDGVEILEENILVFHRANGPALTMITNATESELATFTSCHIPTTFGFNAVDETQKYDCSTVCSCMVTLPGGKNVDEKTGNGVDLQ